MHFRPRSEMDLWLQVTELTVCSINLCHLYLSEYIMHTDGNNVMWWGGLNAMQKSYRAPPLSEDRDRAYSRFTSSSFLCPNVVVNLRSKRIDWLHQLPHPRAVTACCIFPFQFVIKCVHSIIQTTLWTHLQSCFWCCQHMRKTHHHPFITPSLERAKHINKASL